MAILKVSAIVKFTNVESCALLELLQTVHQSISVYIELTGCLGHIQVIFKKFIDCGQCFLIERIRQISQTSVINISHSGIGS